MVRVCRSRSSDQFALSPTSAFRRYRRSTSPTVVESSSNVRSPSLQPLQLPPAAIPLRLRSRRLVAVASPHACDRQSFPFAVVVTRRTPPSHHRPLALMADLHRQLHIDIPAVRGAATTSDDCDTPSAFSPPPPSPPSQPPVERRDLLPSVSGDDDSSSSPPDSSSLARCFSELTAANIHVLAVDGDHEV